MKPIAFIFIGMACAIHAEEKAPDVAKLSEAMGRLIGKNLQSMGMQIDIDSLVQGMKEGCSGKDASFDEDACIQALAQLEEESLNKQAEANLAEANGFLKQNQKQKGVVSLENGKVQYHIIKEGEGNPVETYNSPLLRYKGSYLNGQIFGTSSGDEIIALDETIEGFSKGIVGMREGEVRTIYIHPDLGYGRNGLSMPNALLVFEVELIHADASFDVHEASNAQDSTLPSTLR